MAEFTEQELINMLQNAVSTISSFPNEAEYLIDTSYPSHLFEQEAVEDTIMQEFDVSQVQEMGVKNLLGSLLQLGRNVPKWWKSGGTGPTRESLKNLKKADLIDMIAPPKKGFWESTKGYVKDIPKKAWEGTKKSIDLRVHPISKGIKGAGMGYQAFGTEEGISSPYTAIPIPMPVIGPTPISTFTGYHNLISDMGGNEALVDATETVFDAINTVGEATGAGKIVPSGEEIKTVLKRNPNETQMNGKESSKQLIDNPVIKNMIDSLMNEKAYSNPKLRQLMKNNKDSSIYKYLEEQWGF